MADMLSLRLLQEAQGRQALEAASLLEPEEVDFLPHLQRLSRRFPEALAKAALEQAILRRRARDKFSSADRMFFTREALEQATPEPVALHRSQRFVGSPLIFDLACGIGGDTLALARRGPVVAVDRDLLRLALLRANALALGLVPDVMPVQGDLPQRAWRLTRRSRCFFDPARRQGGRRFRSTHRYSPSLRSILEWIPDFHGMGVKVSPAVDLGEIKDIDCQVEFISLGGELKEATLWFGALRMGATQATVLPGPHVMIGGENPDIGVSEPLAYLYEPDPAILRAGLARLLGRDLQAAQIDPSIGFLTSHRLELTPFAKAYRTIEVWPFGLKRLREALKARDVGELTIKKRGSPVNTEDLAQRLRLRGREAATIILTRVMGKPRVLLVEPVGNSGPEES